MLPLNWKEIKAYLKTVMGGQYGFSTHKRMIKLRSLSDSGVSNSAIPHWKNQNNSCQTLTNIYFNSNVKKLHAQGKIFNFSLLLH